MALTTTAHNEGIAVPDDVWVGGGSEARPFASPWYVATIKTRTFDRMQGRLDAAFVNRVVDALYQYVAASP